MARFLHSIVQPNTDLVASASITPFDLPVNPLSFLILRLEVTNVAPAALDTYSAIDDAITQITAVRVLHKGELIVSGSLRDIMVLNARAFNAWPGWHKLDNLDNAVRSFTFPICLGRKMYDPTSAFPATTRGNLRFEMTAGADGDGYDDINFSVSAVELIEADPAEYVKYTANARDSVAGQFDLPLPIGNPYLGILLFDTGMRDTLAATYSWGTVKLLKDNVEQYYPSEDIETLGAMLQAHVGTKLGWPGHTHQFNGAAAGLDETDEAGHSLRASGANGYAYLDFDPLGDGSYQMETTGAADVKLRGQGDAASAVRAIPVERVPSKAT
jgi:hypothetical protein